MLDDKISEKNRSTLNSTSYHFMLNNDFYQNHLDRVSRSFALCISQVDEPLRRWISLTYLICRILDTVEDAPWSIHSSSSGQLFEFDQFDCLLHQWPLPDFSRGWYQNFPEGISEGEKLLLIDCEKIFQEFHRLPPSVREIIREAVGSMSAGMKHYAQKRLEEGRLQLLDLSQVNQYCFFVAGVVGEALIRLVKKVEPDLQLSSQLMKQAYHFGLFLQKINLLKDQFQDEKDGKYFIYSRDEIIKSLKRHAKEAWQFFCELPISQRGFRLFCAQSLFLGLASLPWLEKAFYTRKPIKIPRLKTLQLFYSLRKKIDDRIYLENWFKKLVSDSDMHSKNNIFLSSRASIFFPSPLPSSSPESSFPTKSETVLSQWWFQDLYKGQLNKKDFFDLGLI